MKRLYLDVCTYCRPFDDQNFLRKAVNALILGILEATRFLALKSDSNLDSVKWHQEWQAQLDKEAFFDEVF
jgi:hypothetical protein